MKKPIEVTPEHLEWLIRGRDRNQRQNAALRELFRDYRDILPKDRVLGSAAQLLVGATFSVWRAVFLGDVGGTFQHAHLGAEQFLAEVVVNNAIAYPQDQQGRDWTFGFYVNNAGFRLRELHERWPDLFSQVTLQDHKVDPKVPRDTWDLYQAGVERAIASLEKALKAAYPDHRPASCPTERIES